MHPPLTRFLTAALLAAASLTAGAQRLLTQIPLPSIGSPTESLEGAIAIDVAVDSATNRIYVPVLLDLATSTSFQVLVIDGATNQVVHKLTGFPVATNPFYGSIAIDSVRNFIYVDTFGLNNTCLVSVIDGRTEKIVKTIEPPYRVCGKMAVDPITGKVYINQGDALNVIESEASGIVDSYNLPFYISNNSEMIISPYVHRLYFGSNSSQNSELLNFYDTNDNQVTESFTIDPAMDALIYVSPVVNWNTGHLFGSTSNSYSAYSLTVFNSQGALLANIDLPGSAGENLIGGIAVDPKTNRAFVSVFTYAVDGVPNPEAGLYVIDGKTNTILSNSTVTYPPSLDDYFDQGGAVGANPDTSKVYLAYYDPTNGKAYLNVYSEQ